SSRRRHTRCYRDWSSDVCSSDLYKPAKGKRIGDQYSDNVRIQTSTVHQEVRLGSLVGNTLKYLILEKAAKEVIQSHCAGVEIERSEERRVGKECRERESQADSER